MTESIQTKPIRLQLSRRKGFDLQATSLAANGLPAVNVARPSVYGNPFKVGEIPADVAVARFREHLDSFFAFTEAKGMGTIAEWVAPLRGKNLACWCRPGEICHADVLLEIANR